VVTVPTIAATCAAWTPLSIIYSPEGKYLESCRRSAQPNRVFVDDEIIGGAPVRYLVSGMGDTLAKWYETDVAVKKRGFNAATLSAHRLSLLCKDMIDDYGLAASQSVQTGENSMELGHVIDAIIAVSGMVSDLGGEGCASAAAHPVAAGLTLIDVVHHMYHGEVVAFGILCQLMLENKADAEVNEFLSICQRLNLPMTLLDLGLESLAGETLEEVAQKAIEAENIHNMPFPVTRDMAAKAILAADARGKAFREAN
jgi:glycerol dehydrogenase